MIKELSISQRQIKNKIFSVRGFQVILDSDLALIYQVETRILNQAVKRNKDRFPEDFVFQLTQSEWEDLNLQNELSDLRSQNGILEDGRGKHRKYLPFVFTEQGVAGLSGVLKSKIASQVHVEIMRAFVFMRKLIQDNIVLYSRLDKIESRQILADQKFEQIFKALEGNSIPTQGVFFDGQVFDAYALSSKIIRTAKESIILIDNYIDETTLIHLSKKRQKVKVILLTHSIGQQLKLDIQKANEQYGDFIVKKFSKNHDRFLIIDEQEIYHLGASLKDLGKKLFAFSKLDKNLMQSLLNKVKETLE